jgi:hypothetical protein
VCGKSVEISELFGQGGILAEPMGKGVILQGKTVSEPMGEQGQATAR